MSPSDVFSIVGMLAMPMWLLMIILPKWKVTRFLVAYKIIPVILSLVYMAYIVQHIANGGGLNFGSLESVMQLFTIEEAVLAGWVHYLAFDLFVGMWILEENQKLKVNHLIIIPCLFLSFMLGPIGFLAFYIIKTLKTSNHE